MVDNKMREALYSLIKAAIGESEVKLPDNVNLEELMNLSIRQSVPSLALVGLEKVSQDIDITGQTNAKLQWIGQTVLAGNTYKHILAVQNEISDLLKKNGLKALVLKGSALANYYSQPHLRQFGDIDIYSPSDFEKIDVLLNGLGEDYELDCYRHSQIRIKGITIENHIYLTDARWKKKWNDLEEFLKKEAEKTQSTVERFGLYVADGLFGEVFFMYHALAHFVYDQLNARFLTDWYYVLKNRDTKYDYEMVDAFRRYGLMKFAAVLTRLCMERIGLKAETVPAGVLEGARKVSLEMMMRFEDDMYSMEHEGFTTSSLRDRIARLSSFYHNRWKIVDYLETSYLSFVWSKVVAILKWK